MIFTVHLDANTDLVEVGDAPDSFPVLFTARQGRNQQSGEDRDDGDDYQQLNESESPQLNGILKSFNLIHVLPVLHWQGEPHRGAFVGVIAGGQMSSVGPNN
jgi:hypothetical protein